MYLTPTGKPGFTASISKVPKKYGGVASHFRFSSSERLRHAAQVLNVNFGTNRATDQIQGLVCHDRSQGRILPDIHPSISQEVPEVGFWGRAYQYRVLPFGLALSPPALSRNA